MNAATGQILAAVLTASIVDDALQVVALLDWASPLALFATDGAYDQDAVDGEVTKRLPETAVTLPPLSSAVPSDTARTAPT